VKYRYTACRALQQRKEDTAAVRSWAVGRAAETQKLPTGWDRFRNVAAAEGLARADRARRCSTHNLAVEDTTLY
jgi:hypothetical protein